MTRLKRKRLPAILAIYVLCVAADVTAAPEAEENRWAAGSDPVWQLMSATIQMGYRCHETGVSLDACLTIAKSVFGPQFGVKP